MAWGYECRFCGASLDPGEKCDCQDIKEAKYKKIENMIDFGKYGGQGVLSFVREEAKNGNTRTIKS